MRPSTLKTLLASAALLLLVAAAPLQAATAVRSTWDCLPPETVLLMRVPAGNNLLASLRKSTKFGAVGLSQDRLDKLMALAREECKNQPDMDKDLAKYNLKTEDWRDLFAGEAGFALALVARKDQKPLAMGFTWFEPGGDLSGRLISAFQKKLDEEKDKPGNPQRVDKQIEGQDVMVLTATVMGSAPAAAEPPAAEGAEAPAVVPAKKVQVDQTYVFITRMGNRILIANTFPQTKEEIGKLLANPDAKIDWPAVTGFEQASGLFAHFLAAHTAKEAPIGAAAALATTSGLAGSLPTGQTAFELMLDPRPLVKLADSAQVPQIPRVLKALGIDTIGPAAMRTVLDGNVMRSGIFVSAPAPRSGILTLLDVPALPAEPPAWVPAAVMSYSRWSFDLGKAYARIKDLVIGEFGQDVQPMFMMGEGQVAGVLGVDVATLLSSLGNEHHLLTLMPTPPAPQAADEPPAAPANPISAFSKQRLAFIWMVKDEPLWKTKVFPLIAGQAAATNGMVAPAEEQGFTGFRSKLPSGVEQGLFLGKGFLTLSIGQGVSEAVLAWLRTPPEGAAALRTSPLFAQAKAILPFEPNVAMSIADNSQSIKMFRDLILQQVAEGNTHMGPHHHGTRVHVGAGAEPADGADKDGPAMVDSPKVVAAKLKAILPTDEEIDGMLGVAVNQATVKSAGLVTSGAIELPPVK